MKFRLLDSIESFEKDTRLVAHKHVHPEEEYLADHFPEFPVLPGVFMLEAATQASAWLLRLSDDMAHSVIVLKEARNVKYADFVKPGERLRVETEITKTEDNQVSFKVLGSIGDRTPLSGKLVLERYNLAETEAAKADPHLAATYRDIDERLRVKLREWRDDVAVGLLN